MPRQSRRELRPIHFALGLSLLANLILVGLVGDGDAEPPAELEEVAEADPLAEPELDVERSLPEAPEPPTTPPPATGDDWRVLRASLTHSIPRTLSGPAEPYGDVLSAAYARLFMWDLDLRSDLRPNDGLAVVYRPDADEQVVIAAAHFESIRLRRTLTAYRWHATGDEHSSYWQQDGTELAMRLDNSPLRDYEQVTSLVRDRPNHRGMDFKTPVGTPVHSPWAGRVTRTNWNWRNNGNGVEIRYENGILAKFLHLSENRVAEGDRVSAGQIIALTGNTGRTTGPHLHYQLDRGDEVLDPIDVHGTHRRSLPGSDRAAFQREVHRLRDLLEAPSTTN
jgi:murein DD-endopeptidase MepM/ murein hydrolase activator NlpD